MAKDSRHISEQEWRQQLPYTNDNPAFVAQYSGSCHCGNVKFATSSDPEAALYCHCTTCQVIHGAPMQWAAILKKENVRFDSASLDSLEFYNSQEKESGRTTPCKVSCRNCGTLVSDEGRNMWLAFPSLFRLGEEVPKAWQATDHQFYGERVIDIQIQSDGKDWIGKKDDSERFDRNEEDDSEEHAEKKRKVE